VQCLLGLGDEGRKQAEKNHFQAGNLRSLVESLEIYSDFLDRPFDILKSLNDGCERDLKT